MKLYCIHIILNVCHGKSFILITQESKNKINISLISDKRAKDFARSHESKFSLQRLDVTWKIQLQVRNSGHCHPWHLPNFPMIWKIWLTFKRERVLIKIIFSPVHLSNIHINHWASMLPVPTAKCYYIILK